MVLAMIKHKKIVCETEENTRFLAKMVAKAAKKRDVFALFGTLGAGKSTFSRYFIEHLSGATEIPSPTFTLVQTYDAPDFEIYHYDMYRLKSPEEAYELDIEEAFYNGVSLIEWPEKIGSLLPKDIWKITITTQGTQRVFDIETFGAEKSQRLEEIFVE